MTQDEIIEMARQAGMMTRVLYLGRNLELLETFAKLVAEKKRTWHGLTDEEIDEAIKSCRTLDTRKYFRAIEAKLKEKNG
jgi:hypothetical protein